MNDIEVRLECLRLAQQGPDPVGTARAFSDFVLGRKDAEINRAAHELAKKVAGNG